jgi:hypothetical protein
LENCELPESHTDDLQAPRIDIRGTKERVVITLNAAAARDNMQKDASAFEPWSLGMVEHCGVKRVIIQAEGDPECRNPHRNRLKYRLARLSELVPEVSAQNEAHLALPVMGDWIVNRSGHRTESVALGNPWLMMQRVKNTQSEKALEMGLEASMCFRKRFGLSGVVRQWPVGLYDGKVTDGAVHFPGDASQIDLVGVNGDELCVFELKVRDHKRDNKKAGALSEAFFYACVMRDILLQRFRFEHARAANNCEIGPSDIMKCRRIKVILLKEGAHHCLLETNGILSRLNRAMRATWNDLPVEFALARITKVPGGPDDDFEFA